MILTFLLSSNCALVYDWHSTRKADFRKKANFIISTEKNIESTKVEVANTVEQLKAIEPKAWKDFYSKIQ